MLRAPTFSNSGGVAKGSGAAPPLTADTLVSRVFGSKNAANQRVSESLDYEPVQNKIFYERMRQAKKERHLFG
jgi:chloride channel 7